MCPHSSGKFQHFSSLVSLTESHTHTKITGLKKRGKGKGGRKMGGYIIFGSHNKQLGLFSLYEVGGCLKESRVDRKKGERCSFIALVIWMTAQRVHESARSPSTTGRPLGLPAPFSPERRAPQGAIRAWMGDWQPCAALQGIHKRWHIDSPCLCAAWVLKAWRVERVGFFFSNALLAKSGILGRI